MVAVADARAFVLGLCRSLPACEVPLEQAVGCVLAEPVAAAHPVPPFDNSAMDGYALRAADTAGAPVRLRVVGTIFAGDDGAIPVGVGEAARIMTGAPMPPGADAVCVVERTSTEGNGAVVVIEDEVVPRQNVRSAGSDLPEGAEAFGPGTVLGPAHVGVLASLGLVRVVVRARPRVAVFVTGDELVPAEVALTGGKIHDSNRPALVAQLRADGFEVVDLGTVSDEEDALVDAFGRARAYDAVVTSGGVSMGERDYVKLVLDKLAQEMRAMQVDIRPARPFAFGTLTESGTPVFALPGNPVSALVSYELFVRPALRKMAGFEVLDRPCVTAVAPAGFRRRPDGKLHLVRVVVREESPGVLTTWPSGGQDSHVLRAMAEANGLALVADGEGVPPGGTVPVLLLDAGALDAGASLRPW